MHDTIVEEIHQFRAQLLAQNSDDFAAYFATLMQRQQENPERYASFVSAKPTQGSGALQQKPTAAPPAPSSATP